MESDEIQRLRQAHEGLPSEFSVHYRPWRAPAIAVAKGNIDDLVRVGVIVLRAGENERVQLTGLRPDEITLDIVQGLLDMHCRPHEMISLELGHEDDGVFLARSWSE